MSLPETTETGIQELTSDGWKVFGRALSIEESLHGDNRCAM
jgi:hypothetical protein